MSYEQAIKDRCNEIASVSKVDIKKIPDDGFNVSVYLTHRGNDLRQDFYVRADVWDEAGEVGVANLAYTLLHGELTYYDEVNQ